MSLPKVIGFLAYSLLNTSRVRGVLPKKAKKLRS